MGKLVVTEFVTLDGVMEDPGGAEGFERGGWAFEFDRGADGDRFKLDELRASDAQLLGRVTYEGFAKAWPTMEETTGEFGVKMNAMPKFVVSATLESPEWKNTTVLRSVSEVPNLKEQFAGDILVAGSAQLVNGLLAEDLVDELRLMVFPTVLGAGKKLFADAAATKALQLVDTKQAGETAVLTFART